MRIPHPALDLQREMGCLGSREGGQHGHRAAESMTGTLLKNCLEAALAEGREGEQRKLLWEPPLFPHGKPGFQRVCKLLTQSTHSLSGLRQLGLQTQRILTRRGEVSAATGWKHRCPHRAMIYGSTIGLGKNSLWPHRLNTDLYSNIDFRQATVKKKIEESPMDASLWLGKSSRWITAKVIIEMTLLKSSRQVGYISVEKRKEPGVCMQPCQCAHKTTSVIRDFLHLHSPKSEYSDTKGLKHYEQHLL